MNSFRLTFLSILLAATLAPAQVVPGRYLVELTVSPLGAEVRTKGKATMPDRVQQIRGQQALLRPLVQQHHGKVLSSLESLMNALIVVIPDSEAAALAALPGVKKVYPVYMQNADLDHALPIHNVPEAWANIGGMSNAGAGIKIGILDTGVSPDHAAFQDSALNVPAGYPLASKPANLALTNNKIIVARSYEDIYQETAPDDARDRFGHGTMVAMCAAGVTNKGPYATITGVAPGAWIGGYKIVPGNSGSASDDVIVKAMDDAVADGMDVINLSFGSPFNFLPAPDSLEGVAVDRLTRFGIVFVTSAGNSGSLSSIGSYASTPSAISVGAIQNDRFLAGSVSVAGGAPYRANPAIGSSDNASISGPLLDITSLDPTGLACSALPAGSATGQIPLISRGACTFESKLNNAQAAGAIGAIIYAAASAPAIFAASAGAATLPLVTVSHADGLAIQASIDANPASSNMATIVFNGISYPESFNQLASFTSQGPNYDLSIKPDLAAVGTNLYMATQSADPTGELYSKSGYLTANGTSFSSPLVTGAVAVVRGYRPGLTVDQYRSLIINGASPFFRHSDGWVERVQRTGAGILNLENALVNTVTAYPTSLTFGVGDGTLGGANTGDFNQMTLTNISAAADTFMVSAIAYDNAPPVQFGSDPTGSGASSTLPVTMGPGQSKTVYVFWTTSQPLLPGEYQGLVSIQASHATVSANIPYWYGVPPQVPVSIFQMNALPGSSHAGSVLDLYIRVTDSIGYPVTDNATLDFRGAATAGGGSIELSNILYFPKIRDVQFKLGPDPATNTFVFSIGNLTPISVTIVGASNGEMRSSRSLTVAVQ
jgi:minor extracellular serine protease Vpr